MRNLANYITAARLIAAPAMLLTKPLSGGFYALYILCGVTDMIDGPVARRTGGESETGARLDSAADTVFAAVCLYMLLPAIKPPAWLLVWTGVIAAVKAVNIVSGLALRRKLVMPHTAANKLTGAMLFTLPLTLGFLDVRLPAACVCAVASFAAVQEGHFIRTGRA